MKYLLVFCGLFGIGLGQQANCIFEGDGTGEVVGEVTLTAFDEGSEIE